MLKRRKQKEWLTYLVEETRRPQGRSRCPRNYLPLVMAVLRSDQGQTRLLLCDTDLRKWRVEHKSYLLDVAAGQSNVYLLRRLLAAGLSIHIRWGYGWTPLQNAVSQGYINIARLLLRRGTDPNEADRQGYDLPLVMAAQQGQSALVRLLLIYGADPNKTDLSERVALVEAALGGHVETLRALLAAGVDPNRNDRHGRTALMVAAAASTIALKMVNLLLAAGADPNIVDKEGATPLARALEARHGEVVEALLNAGADVNLGQSALVAAIMSGTIKSLPALLESGANVYMRGILGRSPLRWAVVKGYRDVVTLLLARDTDRPELHRAILQGDAETVARLLAEGADVNAKDWEGLTPLAWARHSGQNALINVLLAAGVDPNLADMGGRMPLMAAAQCADDEAVRELLARGADVHACEQNGWTALMFAVSHGRSLPITRMLLHAGADIESRGAYGVTALTLAAMYGQEEIVEEILTRGADVNVRIDDGTTALMEAAKEGHQDVIRILLAHGADLHVRAENGYTALAYADWWCDPKGTARLLRDAGAKF